MGAGHTAERVRVRSSSRCCWISPNCPAGQAKVCAAKRVSVSVCVLGVGKTQAGAHVLLTWDHPPQLPEPEQVKERCSTMDPSWPAGQANVRVSGPGQVVQVLLVCVHAPQEPSPEQTNDRCSPMEPTWPLGQESERLSGEGHGAHELVVSVQGPAVVVRSQGS